MSEYTPTTDEVQFAAETTTFEESTIPEGAFEKWLNSVKADAWDEGHGAPCDKWIRSEMCREYHPNPYRTGGSE